MRGGEGGGCAASTEAVRLAKAIVCVLLLSLLPPETPPLPLQGTKASTPSPRPPPPTIPAAHAEPGAGAGRDDPNWARQRILHGAGSAASPECTSGLTRRDPSGLCTGPFVPCDYGQATTGDRVVDDSVRVCEVCVTG